MPYINDLQAQKDWYNGIEFRSKLESKTAQALDNIGIRYEYEPEGYKLTNGMWYRPDFWLPDVKQFIECKGIMSSTDSAKIVGLVEDTNHPVLVISYENAMMVMRFWNDPTQRVVTYNNYIALGECVCCQRKFFFASEDTYACPACESHCGVNDGDHFLATLEWIESGTQLFNYGQQIAADKPIYQEIANTFNN